MKREVFTMLPVALVVVALCWVVDCTSLTSTFEAHVLAPKTTHALGAVLRGLMLPDEILRCTVTAACSGLRTMIACGALAACLHRWRMIPFAIAGGFLLNLARVVIVELLCRVDLPFGMMVHDLALFLVVMPIGLMAVICYRRLARPLRLMVQTYTILLSLCLLTV